MNRCSRWYSLDERYPMTRTLLLSLFLLTTVPAFAQAREGVLSEREVDVLRDTADQPLDRLKAYDQFLNDRDQAMTEVVTGRHGAEYATDVHDLLEQMAGIADELNDNLDDWGRRHRDLRKGLPKLIDLVERWSTVARSPAADRRYDVVRRAALDAFKDTREIATTLAAEQAAYFKEHPEEAAKEKKRRDNPNAPE